MVSPMKNDQHDKIDAIGESEVEHIAHLARLRITTDERGRFAGELGEILSYVNMLQELDTQEIEATFSVLPHYNVLREDVISPSLPPSEVLQNAPDREENLFKMPRILGE